MLGHKKSNLKKTKFEDKNVTFDSEVKMKSATKGDDTVLTFEEELRERLPYLSKKMRKPLQATPKIIL